VGWAAGIERLAMLIAAPPAAPVPVVIIPMAHDDQYYDNALTILKNLRAHHIAAETSYAGNAKKRLERANKSGAAFAVLVGEDIKLKNLATGEQQDVTAENLPGLLRA
jgi:histidyl-tRNA synthetase